ncbi:MAG: Rrf2 family transcriptional regulator [Deltaproteobacteria bacterium]|nr:Rrf2 family transcriptional regulator [Deltaproteobacteria bacterium]
MNINRKTEYAVAIIICINYLLKSGHYVTAKQIFEATSIPPKFLSVILSDLQRAGILKSIRGFGGGYLLNKKLRDISLKDIVRATGRDQTSREKKSENIFQSFALTVSSDLSGEYEKLLEKTNFEELFRRFENLMSPMTPMFYI